MRDLQKAKGDSVPEPERTYILALLGCLYYVYLRETDTNPDLNDPGCTPFQITASDAWSVICSSYRVGGLTPDFLSKHFEYFQRLLVFHCTGLTGKIPNGTRRDYVTATSRRLSACVDDLDVDPRVREEFRKRADACARTADQTCTVM